MRIESIYVGKVAPMPTLYRGKSIRSGILKQPTPGPVMLRSTNLDGDEQADLRVHGGPDKALYAYGLDAYAAWRALRPGDTFAGGSMGENLALSTLPEDELCIGDTFEVGTAVVQVAQPRLPCFKLGLKFDRQIVQQFMQVGRPGVYFRVLREGMIAPGQLLLERERAPLRVSVLDLFRLHETFDDDHDRWRQIVQLPALPAEWRTQITDLLDQVE